MLPFTANPSQLCSGPTRREFLRLGAVTPGRAGPAGTARRTRQRPAPKPQRAKSCLLIFMEGGPSHIDLWDLKPDAPAEVRGEFKPDPDAASRASPSASYLPLSSPPDAPPRPGAVGPPRRSTTTTPAPTTCSPAATRSTASKLIVSRLAAELPAVRGGAGEAAARPTKPIPAFVHAPGVPVEQRRRTSPGRRPGSSGRRTTRSSPATRACRATACPGWTCCPDVPLDRLGRPRRPAAGTRPGRRPARRLGGARTG